jgi:hypothetical protein
MHEISGDGRDRRGSAATQAGAQVAPKPAPPTPVEETQAPENEVLNPEQKVTGRCRPDASGHSRRSARQAREMERQRPAGPGPAQVPIDVDEGTWMNVDVSKDGRMIAFDLLGDIYTMPIAGGTPSRIAEGLAFEHQPRFSPTAGASPSPRTGAAATISGS